MLYLLFLTPVLLFFAVSATMNTLYAWSLGGNAWTSGCFVALGIAAALFAALGPDLIRINASRKAWTKATAAALVLLASLAYDAMATYGFAVREHEAIAEKARAADEPRQAALRRLERAREGLAPYANAPDVVVQQARLQALQSLVTPSRCALPRVPDTERQACERLADGLEGLARAQTRARLTLEAENATAALAAFPAPPSVDSRATLLGDAVAWLPVVLLQLGTLLGVFAAWTPRAAAPASPAEPHAALPAGIGAAPVTPLQLEAPSVVKLAEAIAGNPGCVPPGVTVEKGWIRGPQRPLAKVAGLPLTRFNRELREAARAGAIDLDTTNGTAFRLRATASP